MKKARGFGRGLFMRARFLASTCAFLLLGGFSAEAAPRFSVFGLGEWARQPYFDSSGATITSPTEGRGSLGGGAEIEFPLSSLLGLEFGAVYVPRRLADTTVSPALVTSYNTFELPLQFRLWLGHRVSLGVGGYYSYALGGIQTSSGSTPYSVAGFKKSDEGLLASMGFQIPFHGSTALFVEGRYALGLSDIIDHAVVDATTPSLAGTRVRWRDIQLLLGLRFGSAK
jgi:hypothetical protein